MEGIFSQLYNCFHPSATNRAVGANQQQQLHQLPDVLFTSSELLDETLGYLFCYVRSSARFLFPTPSDRYLSPTHSLCFSPPHHDGSTKSRTGLPKTGFRAILGASVSGNSFTPRTVLEQDVDEDGLNVLRMSEAVMGEGGFFMSGPIERGALSGPLDGNLTTTGSNHEDSIVEWALGKAGEDRVHLVVSEEHGWLLVGIYDGFNGPDAPEFLMANFYRAMYNESQRLFWEVEQEQHSNVASEKVEDISAEPPTVQGSAKKRFAFSIDDVICVNKAGSAVNRRWLLPSVDERPPRSGKRRKVGLVDHELVLNAMSTTLDMMEAAYLDMIDKFLDHNPELALMGSCLMVVLMRDEDVYVMNVGDSRAIVAQSEQQEEVGPSVDSEEQAENGSSIEGIVEEPTKTLSEKANEMLSTDRSTSIEEEVLRIKSEHPDDIQCILDDRVKGRLKVTRAFGAGFLKQPKWNDPLLEMFCNDYIGTAPYVSCTPSLRHHKLCQREPFLVLSSDGLYQYLTNQEVVSHVESFMEKSPEGDPAQHLIEELLSRAAKLT
ncbi:hypothetical protein QQ045_013532 [Rhodiola kirilowii]